MPSRSIVNIFIVGIILSSLLLFPFILDLALVPRFMALAVCLVLIFYYLRNTEFNIRVKPDLILVSYAAYVLVCCLSIFWSHTRSEAFFDAGKQVIFFLVFLLTFFSLKTDHDYFSVSILKFSIVLSIILFLAASYQLSGLQTFTKESFYEISGLNGHKNLFASFLFLNLFFLIRAYYRLDAPWKTVAVICMALTCVLLFLLKTKAVWLGLIVTIGVSAVLLFSRKFLKTFKVNFYLLLIIALVFLNVFFLFLLQPVIHKSIHYTSQINSSKGESSVKLEEERLVLWDKTYHLFKQKPLLGVGMGNWQIYLPDATLSNLWRGEDLNFTFQRPHNDFLWILSETGIIGLNLFLLFVLAIIFSLARTLSFITDNKLLLFDVLLCGGFIAGYFTISFFDFPKERAEHGVWISIILGTAYYSIKTLRPVKTFGEIKPGNMSFFWGLVLMSVIVFTMLMRLNGEFFTRRMFNHRSSGQLLNLVNAGKAASSFAYSIDPTSVPLYWYIGNAHASLGKYDEAQKDFIEAYQRTPYNRNVLNDLASSYVFTNNVLLAKKYYEEAARISPRFDDPKLNLAAMYINAKDYKTASFWLRSIMHDSERRTNYEKIVELQNKSTP